MIFGKLKKLAMQILKIKNQQGFLTDTNVIGVYAVIMKKDRE